MHISASLLLTSLFNALLFFVSADKTAPTLSRAPCRVNGSYLHDLATRVDNQEGSVALLQKHGLYYVSVSLNGQQLRLGINTRASAMYVLEAYHTFLLIYGVLMIQGMSNYLSAGPIISSQTVERVGTHSEDFLALVTSEESSKSIMAMDQLWVARLMKST